MRRGLCGRLGGLQERCKRRAGMCPSWTVKGLWVLEEECDEVVDRQGTLGARLHHCDQSSDCESDNPEEAEFAPNPRLDG